MDKQQLTETLRQLHDDLMQAEQLDPDTLKLLQTVTQDINRLLQQSETISTADVEPVSRGLNSLLLKYEAEHPKLASAIGNVADALANMGI